MGVHCTSPWSSSTGRGWGLHLLTAAGTHVLQAEPVFAAVLPLMTPTPSPGCAASRTSGQPTGPALFPCGRGGGGALAPQAPSTGAGCTGGPDPPGSCPHPSSACLGASQGHSFRLKGPPSGQILAHRQHSRQNQPQKHFPCYTPHLNPPHATDEHFSQSLSSLFVSVVCPVPKYSTSSRQQGPPSPQGGQRRAQ